MESANENSADVGILHESPRSAQLLHPTPENPPWNSVVALLFWVASVFAIAIVPVVFVLPYILSQGPGVSENKAVGEFLRQDATAILLQIIAIIPAHLLTIAVAWVIVTKMNTFSFRDTLGWESGGMKPRDYFFILAAFFAVAIIVGKFFPEQENELTRILQSSRSAVFLVAFMATFTAPIVEEVIYRGILYSAFQRTFGVSAAVVAVTLLFALVHVPQYYPSYSTIALLLLLSLTLTVVRARTGNLWPCIVLHTIFNGVQSILLILEPYVDVAKPVVEPTAASLFLK